MGERSNRFAVLAEDGKVKHVAMDEGRDPNPNPDPDPDPSSNPDPTLTLTLTLTVTLR